MNESSETRIALLENNNLTIMEKIDAIIATLEKFDDKLDKALEKKADKWAELVLKWAGGIIGAALLTTVIVFIEKVLNK